MKRISLIFPLLSVFLSSYLYPQVRQGSFEISVFGNAGVKTERTEVKEFPQNDNETSCGFVALVLHPGYYLLNSFAFEPELLWTAIEGQAPSFSLSGNISYNIAIPRSRFVLFILAGYGIGNSIPTFQRVSDRLSSDLDIQHLNGGIGAKLFFIRQAAIRAEYRYQYFMYEYSSAQNSYTVDRTWRIHNLFFGFSFFLR